MNILLIPPIEEDLTMYYWDRISPNFANFDLTGGLDYCLIAAGVKRLLQKVGTNHKLSSVTGRTSILKTWFLNWCFGLL